MNTAAEAGHRGRATFGCALVVATGVVLAVAAAGAGRGGVAQQPVLQVTGGELTVYDWSRSACAPDDIPDLPARAFRDWRGRTQLILSHYVNRRLVGRDLDHLRPDCRPVLLSHNSPSPAEFDDRRWIGSLYTADGRTVYALVHAEFQGQRHAGRCPSGVYLDCWYNALTFAVSRDGGDSYHEPPLPSRLVAAIPQRYRPSGGPAGIFEPSNIVRNPADGYFYVLVREVAYGGSVRGTCVLRTRTPGIPSSWRGWDGASFAIRFRSAYATAGGSFCAPVARAEIGEMTESLTYNLRLRRFLLVGVSNPYDAGRGRQVWGIYYSVSADLLNWTPRRLLLEVPTIHNYVCGGADPIAYPSVIDPSSPSRTFSTSDARVYLYFTRYNYRDCRQTLDRDLVRVIVTVGEGP